MELKIFYFAEEKKTRESENRHRPSEGEGGGRKKEEDGQRERTRKKRERGGDTGERQGRGEIERGRGKTIEKTARGCRRAKGEGENLLAFYVSNYTKDGITYPTGRPPSPSSRSQPANQPTRDLLFRSVTQPPSTPGLRSSFQLPLSLSIRHSSPSTPANRMASSFFML